jgi:hypothetical protein
MITAPLLHDQDLILPPHPESDSSYLDRVAALPPTVRALGDLAGGGDTIGEIEHERVSRAAENTARVRELVTGWPVRESVTSTASMYGRMRSFLNE